MDDWAVYLSKQKRDRHKIDLLNDYVCVISGGAFEVKLYFNEPVENMPLVNIFLFLCVSCFLLNIVI